MSQFSVSKRNHILFPSSVAAFRDSVRALKEEIAALVADHPEAASSYLQTAIDVAVDLRSYLTHWCLDAFVASGALTTAEVCACSEQLLSFAAKNGATDAVAQATAEIAAIASSRTKQMIAMSDKGKLRTWYGHDYSSNLTFAMRRGARWLTSNPCKITGFMKDHPDVYARYVCELKSAHPNATTAELTSRIFVKICAPAARELLPIHRVTGGEWGFIHLQVDPFLLDDADAMVDQINFFYKLLQEELAMERPNIVFKLPATQAGLCAAKTLIASGHRLCATLNFTVSQHMAFAEVFAKSPHNCFLVLMGGLLDDKVAAELEAMGIENAKEYAKHASQAVIRKSYQQLMQRGYSNSAIMTAAVRGPWHIANSLVPGDKNQLLITTLPDKISEFDAADSALTPTICNPMDEPCMAVLQKSKVFRTAYADLGDAAFTWECLHDYPPFVAFREQFQAAYRKVMDSFGV